MSTITIELPAEVVPDATTPEEFAHELRLAAAIHWYGRGEISQGKGAQIAGLDRRSFILALGRAGVGAIQNSSEELRIRGSEPYGNRSPLGARSRVT